jgi:hypothetical protein
MPKISTPSQRQELRNHPSWEDDTEAQKALGPIIAKWLAQGVLEYVQWDDRRPVLLQSCGAVPKGSAPFYRLITDARFGNTMYSDWGVTYSSAADLPAALQPRDFTWSADLQDAYHLSVFAGCGDALRPCKRPIVQGDGSVTSGSTVTWSYATRDLVSAVVIKTCPGSLITATSSVSRRAESLPI